MLAELRAFNIERGGVEEMVDLLAHGEIILNKFRDLEDTGVETPEWLEPKLRQIRREVASRTADILEKKIADAKLRMDNLKTPQEKRTELTKRLRELEGLRDAVGVK